MNELQRFTNELGLSASISREKNLYKLQNTLAPQLYKGKNIDDIKLELQRNTILFCTTSDNDFMCLLKLALEMYIIEKKEGKRPIYNGDYIIKYNRLLDYMRKYNCESWLDFKDYISKNIHSDYWEEVYRSIKTLFVDEPVDRKDDYMRQPHDPLKDFLGKKSILDELNNIDL